jgi:hypothetical protein
MTVAALKRFAFAERTIKLRAHADRHNYEYRNSALNPKSMCC